MVVAPDHVYLIPPKKEMIISEGRLLLSERDRGHELSLPIDVFFRSLARDCGARAIAVVLSGGGSDGSRGIRAIHDAGGLVVVQDTESAQFDGMPKTARDAGVADWVLSPAGDAARPRRARGAAGQGRAARVGRRAGAPAAFPERLAGTLRGLRDARERVRHRLHPLQAQHGDQAHRAAPDVEPRRAPGRLRRAPEARARRARRPLPRPAHRGDAVLPQRGRVPGAGRAGLARDAPPPAARRAVSGVGRGLRDGRRGLLARHPARRADDRARGPAGARSSPPTCTALLSSTRRAAPTTRRPWQTCRPSASSATSHGARAASTWCPTCGSGLCSRRTTSSRIPRSRA